MCGGDGGKPERRPGRAGRLIPKEGERLSMVRSDPMLGKGVVVLLGGISYVCVPAVLGVLIV